MLIEKLVIKIMAAPGLYEQAAISNGWELATGCNIRHFTTDEAGMLSELRAMQLMYTEMGVDLELIDNAHPFADTFLCGIVDNRVQVPGWTMDAAVNLLLDAQQYGLRVPPGLMTDNDKEFTSLMTNNAPKPSTSHTSTCTPNAIALSSRISDSVPASSVGAPPNIIPSQFPDLAPDALASYNIGALAGPSPFDAVSPVAPNPVRVASDVIVRLPASDSTSTIPYGDADVSMGA
ncbi:hypothetical protein C8R44DRAFT_889052 [Mycena epipterygia]|nr:hypothetical protein C8R44DRAFT_889052 [Mycena epipterygia]